MSKQGDDSYILAIAMIVAVFIFFGLGIGVGWKESRESTDERWRREAIKNGHAEYHKTTGVWQWKPTTVAQ